MKNIVVTKFGNEPDIFGNSLRCGMIGDWETFKLLKILSDDKQNNVIYFGKAKWDVNKAMQKFNNHVTFIESSEYFDAIAASRIANINEFHIILGPHAFYNGGIHISSWESIKTSIVTERLLERVAPQIKLINASQNAKLFFYLSDRRFLLQAADLVKRHDIKVFAQSIENSWYDRPSFETNNFSIADYSSMSTEATKIVPFRFETLWLYDKNYNDYKNNLNKTLKSGYVNLVIPANQVTSDKEIASSRLDKILTFTDYVRDFTVVGKWTNQKAIDMLQMHSSKTQLLDGLDLDSYNKLLLGSKYALVLFNTNDAPDCFKDNWLTVKYWECAYHGCLTFVEASETLEELIPRELQVKDNLELRDKLEMCENDNTYKLSLLKLQDTLVKREYFSGKYFNDFINGVRQNG